MLVEETTVPAAALPVDQFKAHLQLGTGFADDNAQDEVLESFLRAAMAAIEARTGKILLTREFSWNLTDWRDETGQALPVAPVSAVVEVALIDAQDNEDLLAANTYRLEQDHHRPKLVPLSGALPSPVAGGSISVGFLAGFAAEFDNIPADLAQAVLMLAAHFYEHRHSMAMGDAALPYGVAVLIERYKTIRILGGGRS